MPRCAFVYFGWFNPRIAIRKEWHVLPYAVHVLLHIYLRYKLKKLQNFILYFFAIFVFMSLVVMKLVTLWNLLLFNGRVIIFYNSLVLTAFETLNSIFIPGVVFTRPFLTWSTREASFSVYCCGTRIATAPFIPPWEGGAVALSFCGFDWTLIASIATRIGFFREQSEVLWMMHGRTI